MEKKVKGNSNRLKYGISVVILSVVFVAIVILINLLLTFIGGKKSLYKDLTSENFYSVSDESIEQLKDIDKNVEITFFTPREDIENGSLLGYVKFLAEEYKGNFKFIKVKYVDMVSSPAVAATYKTSPNDVIRTDSVVISCSDTGSKKLVQLNGFYTFKEDGKTLYGFNGEKRFTSCILQVTNPNKPKALFTTGHDEFLSGPLATFIAEEGYDVGVIDLATETISEGTELIIINKPTKDFLGLKAEKENTISEINKLGNYLKNDFGDVIITLAPGAPELPELSALLEEWGLGYTTGAVVQENSANSVDQDGLFLITKYNTENPESFEYQIHRAASERGLKMISPYTVPLKIFNAKDREEAMVLCTSENSIIIDALSGETKPEKNIPTIAVSSYGRYVENEEKRATIMLIGSPYFFDQTYLTTSTYANSEILYGAMKVFGNSAVAVDIPPKAFNDKSITLSKSEQATAALCVTVLLPVLIAGVGAFVCIRRKMR